ncbi:MAG TPA: hypothetical protein VMV37_15870 [Gammaproteobacteria bacterium]|nr:hypothetical protein [Gammaproteobacteria bacterium]
MYHKVVSLGLSVAAALCLTALRASAADDVTVQVLDDVKDAAKVVADVDRELHAAAQPHAVKPDEPANAKPRLPDFLVPPVESGPRPSYFGTIIDREEESEGEIEDFDVPKDVVVPPSK